MVETGPSRSARRLPLDSWHQKSGASRFEERFGCALPVDFGDPAAEYRQLVEGGALVDLSQFDRLEVVGEDRKRFLNGLCTCHVEDLEPGESRFGFVTDAKGKVLSAIGVLGFEDRLWLKMPPGTGPDLRAHFQRYLVADRVEFRGLDDLLLLALAGGAVPSMFEGLGVSLPAPGRHAMMSLLGTSLEVDRHRRLGVDTLDLWISSAVAEPLIEDLQARFAVTPAGLAATEMLRVGSGVPSFGVDYDSSNLPQEVGIEGAVDFEKGCYLGQEVIARVHYRGKAARRLCQLRIEGSTLPVVGSDLTFEGRQCGTLTSAVIRPETGGCWGLAMLQRRAAESGSELFLEEAGASDRKARVERAP